MPVPHVVRWSRDHAVGACQSGLRREKPVSPCPRVLLNALPPHVVGQQGRWHAPLAGGLVHAERSLRTVLGACSRGVLGDQEKTRGRVAGECPAGVWQGPSRQHWFLW